MAKIAMLGTGFIADFYISALHGQRSRDRVIMAYSTTKERAKPFAKKHNIHHWTNDLHEAVNHPEVDIVCIGLRNNQHLEAATAAAKAGKAVMCTKPLARNGKEAWEMVKAVEKAGVFAGYLEDLVYTPKNLKAVDGVKNGAIGRVLWAKSRETHPGPHSPWFWDKELAGGGALVDLGCHCIEIARSFIGKNVRPVEVMCWADTQVKPIDAEDHAIGLVKYANGAIGQFEVSWSFRGGMDLRDEVMGTDGTIWLNNFLRTGFEMFTAPGKSGYVAEKAESASGWLFPVGDETNELGYNHMFTDMLNAMESGGQPVETFYDGYVVNEIMDACYRSAKSKKWEPIKLKEWRGLPDEAVQVQKEVEYDKKHWLLKEEVMPDGSKKLLLKDKKTGKLVQKEMSE
ncbi:MAG: Gfo/Idh/MocA family oxidoreductase [Lewinellaceae bacterium]|nr:Gfo/Idh/MocA family oxidoreductase [Saprospiraceae bacterium]MCB9340710.1 Gfo/Idh/MocA family oxidoreductase [Lewinellaceae bacterium]